MLAVIEEGGILALPQAWLDEHHLVDGDAVSLKLIRKGTVLIEPASQAADDETRDPARDLL
jgi:hypothetical protein